MAVTAKVYASFYLSVFNKELDLDTDVLYAMLCTSLYTPSQGTHRYKSDVTNEASGTGYTAGGVALNLPGAVTVTKSGNTVTLDAPDTAWPDSTVTGRYLVIYGVPAGGATDATKPLISYVDFGSDVSTTSGTFQSVWNSSGILAVSVA